MPLPPLPTVAGTLVRDIDPSAFPLADGTPLTFANSGLTPVTGSPTYQINTYIGGLGSIAVQQGLQGFSIPRPVQDDFSLYVVISDFVGQNTGGNWYNNAPLIDCEHANVGNDFGVTIRGDGKLSVGVGNPDVTVTGTHVVQDRSQHVISVVRVKATGSFKVWVDGVLDVPITNNVNSLSYNPNMYFGSGESGGKAGGYYGRILCYDAAHNTTDRQALENYLLTYYIKTPQASLTKLNSYAVTGPPPRVIAASKLLTYALTGPGFSLSATKIVCYAVLRRHPQNIGPQIY